MAEHPSGPSKKEYSVNELTTQLESELKDTIRVGEDVMKKVDSIRESAESLEKFDENFMTKAQKAVMFINKKQSGETRLDLTPEQRTALVDNILKMDEQGGGMFSKLESDFGTAREGLKNLEETAESLQEDVDELNELENALKSTLRYFYEHEV
jgi:predicted  nucleic acid-binding Zn-ribbon protein